VHLDIVRIGKGGDGLKELAFVDKHETEVVSSRIFLVHLSECGGEIKTTKEESDGNGFSS
jgi:hypothetical protein